MSSTLCRLSMGLACSLAEVFPEQPEVLALLALLMLHDARRDARLGTSGSPVPLPEQDRSQWDQAAIAQATRILDTALSMSRRGPLQIDAAIAATHCRALCAEETDWKEITALYGLLEELRPTPAVRVTGRSPSRGHKAHTSGSRSSRTEVRSTPTVTRTYISSVERCSRNSVGSKKPVRAYTRPAGVLATAQSRLRSGIRWRGDRAAPYVAK